MHHRWGRAPPEPIFESRAVYHCVQYFDKKIRDFVVDAQVTCNKSVFIAHNNAKHANVEPHIYFDEKGPHIIFVALRDIQAGEAITFDYGKSYWEKLGMKPLERKPRASINL